MALQALVFDVDGTLADTERDGHRPTFNAAFAQAGLAWHWDVDVYGGLLGVTGGKERIRHFCERHDPGFVARSDADEAIAVLHADKTRRYVAFVAEGRIGLRPGVARLVAEARSNGTRLAIEDSSVGLHAAVTAGLPTVVTRSPYTLTDHTTGALAVLPDLSTVTLADLAILHDTVHPDTRMPPGPTH